MMLDSCCCTLERELVAIRKKRHDIPAVFDPSVYKDEGQSKVFFFFHTHLRILRRNRNDAICVPFVRRTWFTLIGMMKKR